MLVRWSTWYVLVEWYNVLAIWCDRADDVRGHGPEGGHDLAEEAPKETYAALQAYFGEGDENSSDNRWMLARDISHGYGSKIHNHD